MDYEPKITLTEALFIGSFLLLTDIIGIVLVLFGLDDFFILDIVRFPITGFYYWFKGLRMTSMWISNILETLPYVGALPNATIGWIITVWMDRYPETSAKLASVAGIVPLINK